MPARLSAQRTLAVLRMRSPSMYLIFPPSRVRALVGAWHQSPSFSVFRSPFASARRRRHKSKLHQGGDITPPDPRAQTCHACWLIWMRSTLDLLASASASLPVLGICGSRASIVVFIRLPVRHRGPCHTCTASRAHNPCIRGLRVYLLAPIA